MDERDDDLAGDDAPPKTLNLDDPEIAARWDAAEVPAQKIRHALAMGHRDLARRRLEEAEHVLRTLAGTENLRETAIAQIDGIDLQTVNVLEQECDAVTIGDLLQISPNTLMTTPNFGHGRLYKLLASLLKHTVNRCTALEARVAELEGAQS